MIVLVRDVGAPECFQSANKYFDMKSYWFTINSINILVNNKKPKFLLKCYKHYTRKLQSLEIYTAKTSTKLINPTIFNAGY